MKDQENITVEDLQELPMTRRQKILNRRNRVGRIYAGQLVCDETYSTMSPEERSFWNKCFKTYVQGKTIFKWQGQEHVVPWMTTDGKFSTLKRLEELQELQNKLENGESTGITGIDELSDARAVSSDEPENMVEDTTITSTV